MSTDEMNTQWDVSVPDATLAAYVDDALAPLLNGKKDDKSSSSSAAAAAAADVKHLAPGEERTRRHTMPSIPSCAELYVSVTTEVSSMHCGVCVAGLEKIMIFNKKSKKSDFFDLNQIFLI